MMGVRSGGVGREGCWWERRGEGCGVGREGCC